LKGSGNNGSATQKEGVIFETSWLASVNKGQDKRKPKERSPTVESEKEGTPMGLEREGTVIRETVPVTTPCFSLSPTDRDSSGGILEKEKGRVGEYGHGTGG